jgi:hypothetical protein
LPGIGAQHLEEGDLLTQFGQGLGDGLIVPVTQQIDVEIVFPLPVRAGRDSRRVMDTPYRDSGASMS